MDNFGKMNKWIVFIIIGLLLFTPIAFASEQSVEKEPPKTDKDDVDTTSIEEMGDDTVQVEEGDEDFSFPKFKESPDYDSLGGLESPSLSALSITSSSPSTKSPLPNKDAIKDLSEKFLDGSQIGGTYSTNLFTGAASFSYGLKVPPGTNGLSPNINLNYNHHHSNFGGSLGNGWSLPKNYIYRDTNGTLSSSEDDILKIHFGGTYSKLVYTGSEYKTESENYWRIEKKDTGKNEKGIYWVLTTKDGTKYRFGYREDSELVSNQENFVSVWSLDLIKDTHNNTIVYNYMEELNGDYYPALKNITYNEGINKIRFRYEKGDVVLFYGYKYGTKIERTSTIKDIVIENSGGYGDPLVRRYRIDYLSENGEKFIKKITLFGEDNSSSLPPTEFVYNSPEKGWEDKSDSLPSEIYASSDNGARMIDINSDSFSDFIKIDSNGDLDYWINDKGSGWSTKNEVSRLMEGGIVDDRGMEEGVRFFDVNGDTRIDMVKAFEGPEGNIREVFLNKNGGWEEKSIHLPEGINFVRQKESSCSPNSCPEDFRDEGVSCGVQSCVRTCSIKECYGSGRVVFDQYSDDNPDWNDNDENEGDDGDEWYHPSSNKCYKFMFTGSKETDDDDNECYDLNIDDKYADDDDDCEGDDIDAHAGIGFKGSGEYGTWLRTVPGGRDYGYIGNVENRHYRYKYMWWEDDGSPDDSGSDEGDWEDFNDHICDEAGTYSIFCAPSYSQCDLWGKSRCGYGCGGEGIESYVTLGVFKDLAENDLWDALNEYDPACEDDLMDDNDYDAEDNHFKVIEYDTRKENYYRECTYDGGYIETGVRLAYINDDKKIDLIQANDNRKEVWLAKNDGFEVADWSIPSGVVFSTNGEAEGTKIADINGDGLSDLVKSDGGRKTWLNTGKGWKEDSKWVVPSGASFVSDNYNLVIMDVNGDGKVDLVKDGSSSETWLNTGEGWRSDSGWNLPQDIDMSKPYSRVADINGDGALDLLNTKSDSENKVYENKVEKRYLLEKVKKNFGGIINIGYKKISNLDNTGEDGFSDLPFSGWVVSVVNKDNGGSGKHKIVSETSYDYYDGLYNSTENEFRGFGEVIVYRTDGSKVKNWFYQDKARKGLSYRKVLIDSGEIKKEVNKEYDVDKERGVYETKMGSIKKTIYEHSGQEVTKTTFGHDMYGNIINTSYLGDIGDEEDDKFEYKEYVYNEDKWILDKPKRIYAINDAGEKIREVWLRYDEKGYGEKPSKGDLTYREKWLDDGKNPVDEYEYSDYGNLDTHYGPRLSTTIYVYDSTNTFPKTKVNDLSHITYFKYDLGTGNLLWRKDANRIKEEYVYDVFGRKIKEIGPYDTIDSPSVRIYYEIDRRFPEKIRVTNKESSSDMVETVYYYDGFGNLIQKKLEGDNGFIGEDYSYDSMGRLKERNNLYPSSKNYCLYNESSHSKGYSYDPLGRITKVINPDGTEREVKYDKWKSTLIDEEGDKMAYYEDASGNIVMVEEFNEGEIYTTNYSYDASNKLLGVEDNKGNEISYEYDSLGRKTKISDPDIGNWSYGYNLNGRPVLRIDSRGEKIRKSYDYLGRLKTKTYGENEIKYIYDENKKGTLTRVESPTINISYWYDNEYRVVKREKEMGNFVFTTKFKYDAMDRVVEKTLPDGENISYRYGKQGVNSIGGYLEEVKYKPSGKIRERKYNNSLSTHFSYFNSSLRLRKIKTGELQNTGYNYDRKGNIISITNNLKGERKSFRYDDLDRLKFVNNSGEEINYSYDSIGNMLSVVLENRSVGFIYGGRAGENNPAHSASGVTIHYDDVEGDVNNDNKVNIFDLAAVGLAYGSREGEGNWNGDADLNMDGQVNIFDMATVGKNYGD